MNNIIKGLFTLTLLASATAQAGFVVYIPTEVKLGGSLPDGSINFIKPTDGSGSDNGSETPVEPELPTEPETPVEPEEKREFLYSTALNHYRSSDTSFLFSNTTFAGTPFLCGEITSNCVMANIPDGTVVFKYVGHNPNYGSSFYIPDLIVLKTSYYNSSVDCKFAGTTSSPWDVNNLGGVKHSITYNCGAGNLPPVLQPPYTADKNPGTSFGFSADFYKIVTE
ncbi:hypothetical protein [Pseudomonas putida]|uniref:hypothetical protein n=1 Tax=Pseudomonas putida TaxID=303 RepID=UPI0013AF29ED|nr:hypothetical protein [Pseudomonas putida]